MDGSASGRATRIAAGTATVDSLFRYYSHNQGAYPREAYRMTFVSNHDKNAWEGTQFESFGDALEAAIVLSVVGEGMPLIYNGQEAGNPRRLAFFDRDPIEWRPHAIGNLYKKLFGLKRSNTALWNGQWGARMIRVWNSRPDKVFSFVRGNDRDKVFAVMNLSGEPQVVRFSDAPYQGSYTEFFTDEHVSVADDFEIRLQPWEYRVYVH